MGTGRARDRVAAGIMAKAAASRPDDPLTRRQLATSSPASPNAGRRARRSGSPGDDGEARLGAGRSTRPRTDSAKPSRSGQGCRSHAADPLRHRGRRAPPRAPDEPSGGTGRARAAPERSRRRAPRPHSRRRRSSASATGTRRTSTTLADVRAPALTPWQRRSCATRCSFIGYPYVWGGESELESAQTPLGVAGSRRLRLLRLRLARLQAGAVRRRRHTQRRAPRPHDICDERRGSRRARSQSLTSQPADVIFFGAQGPKSKPAQVDHTGIYLGNGWFIHSSGYGVAVATLSGWYASSFAWGRRPLAEAGLVSPAQ